VNGQRTGEERLKEKKKTEKNERYEALAEKRHQEKNAGLER